jgi:hypothetical protein
MTNRKRTAGTTTISIGGGTDVFAEPRYVWVLQCSNRLALHAATLDRRGRKLSKDLCRGGVRTLSGQLVVGPKNQPSVASTLTHSKPGSRRMDFICGTPIWSLYRTRYG